jgi:hypothetical protein
LPLNIVDASSNLRPREVIAEAEHGGEARRNNPSELSANDLATLAVISTSLRVADDDGGGDADKVIRRDLARKRPSAAV